jgi:hypothetical protein
MKKKLCSFQGPLFNLGLAIVLSGMVQLDLEGVSTNLLFTLAVWTWKYECNMSQGFVPHHGFSARRA